VNIRRRVRANAIKEEVLYGPLPHMPVTTFSPGTRFHMIAVPRRVKNCRCGCRGDTHDMELVNEYGLLGYRSFAFDPLTDEVLMVKEY
jgi:hypothetical protein